MINKYFDKIYVINLFYREDRLDAMKTRLADNNITNYEVIDAYVGEILSLMPTRHNFAYNESGMGCLMSHLRCIKDALYNKYDRILILEDDVLLHKDFNNQFEIITNQLGDTDWDLLYLGHQTIDSPLTHETFYEEGKHIFEARNSWGGHAYGLNRVLMNEYYNHFTKRSESGWMEVDKYLSQVIQENNNFNSVKVYPQLFIQDTGWSDITEFDRVVFKDLLNTGYSKFEDYK